jgi:hypothetical protein
MWIVFERWHLTRMLDEFEAQGSDGARDARRRTTR